MIIYNFDPMKMKKTVSHEELQFLGIQIRDLVKTYRTKVCIKDTKCFQVLNYLEELSNKILACRYSELFVDPRIITFDEPYEISYTDIASDDDLPF